MAMALRGCCVGCDAFLFCHEQKKREEEIDEYQVAELPIIDNSNGKSAAEPRMHLLDSD
jgi:hypothetical protein